jgi:diaminohydroxyphosphoribosylaminopyrimidine deaminase/5-amino-6-(5-phosphoribosylamino)uracil reductase
MTRLLIEGGSHLSASFLRAGLVDRIYWFSALMLIGGDGTPTVAGMGFEHLAQAPKFNLLWQQKLGNDTLTIMERKT